MTVGAYYFGGWAGQNALAGNDQEPWAQNAPTHLTRRMLEEFPEREPVWGWRDDSPETMERQIDLAADSGLAFFAFCWYWHDNGKTVNPDKIKQDPKHAGMDLFLKAQNRRRLKFCLLIANHQGYEITGTENWKAAADAWLPYLRHPQCLTVGGKPLLIIFNARGGDQAGFAYLQERAQQAGLPDVAITGCGGGTPEMGYTHSTRYNVVPGYVAGSESHRYAELAAANRQAWSGSREQPCIPIVTAGWDKRPWEGPTGLKQEAGWYYPDRTPEQFAVFLRDAFTWMDAHPDQTTTEKIALIYAWNEFGEGGYIAPTKGDPDGKYLKALRSVIAKSEPTAAEETVAAVVGSVKTGKILFLGNSITRHGPLAAVGWTDDWGMAASTQDTDYVHVLARSIATITGTAPVTMIENIADFEREYDTYAPGKRLQKAFEFKADTIIVAIGENVPPLASAESKARFRESLLKLLQALKDAGDPTIIVRSSFWPDDAKDEILKQACAVVGGVFVDISSLSKDESNYARSERNYAHSGVAAHPGDKGMQAIADALLVAMKNTKRTKSPEP